MILIQMIMIHDDNDDHDNVKENSSDNNAKNNDGE